MIVYKLGSQSNWSWRWRRQPLHLNEIQQFHDCQNLLAHVHLSNNEDRWQWTKDPSGKFTVASMRRLLNNPTITNNFTFQWNSWVPLKANIFAWRAEKERIATRSALRIRGIHLDSHLCPLCGDYEENADHLLVSCYVANMVWHYISSWCKIQPIFAFTIKNILEFHKAINASKRKQKLVQAIILTSCWTIWKTRNEKTFDNKDLNLAKLF
ncbi:hypothetical protein QVD17_06507 [Tagetes erecta]|uniref:Reverse transcriptase zinc-binding domain-containing protein n=1 Tax=Tagetes erecta TaxID=13708 RepID=A0AAD8LJH9_TARER|nr:hypothetical protein QVD17_06507 [Tagetes erecta]